MPSFFGSLSSAATIYPAVKGCCLSPSQCRRDASKTTTASQSRANTTVLVHRVRSVAAPVPPRAAAAAARVRRDSPALAQRGGTSTRCRRGCHAEAGASCRTRGVDHVWCAPAGRAPRTDGTLHRVGSIIPGRCHRLRPDGDAPQRAHVSDGRGRLGPRHPRGPGRREQRRRICSS